MTRFTFRLHQKDKRKFYRINTDRFSRKHEKCSNEIDWLTIDKHHRRDVNEHKLARQISIHMIELILCRELIGK